MNKKVFIAVMLFFCSTSLFSQIDTVWNYEFAEPIRSSITVTKSAQYIIAAELNRVYFKNDGKYEYFETKHNLSGYQEAYSSISKIIGDTLFIYHPENDSISKCDISFINDYNTYSQVYFNEEIIVLFDEYYMKVLIFDINTKEILDELSEQNGRSMKSIKMLPNNQSFLCYKDKEFFIYDYKNKTEIKRFTLDFDNSYFVFPEVINDSICYFQNTGRLSIVNFLDETVKYQDYDTSTEVNTSFYLPEGNSNSIIWKENNSHSFLNCSTLEKISIPEDRSDYNKILIEDLDTIYFYNRNYSSLEIWGSFAYAKNYYKDITDTLFYTLSYDTLFYGIFQMSHFKMLPNSNYFFDRYRIYNLTDSKFIDSIPNTNSNSYLYPLDSVNIVLGNTPFTNEKLYIYNVETKKIDSIENTPLNRWGTIYEVKFENEQYHIFDSESGEIVYTSDEFIYHNKKNGFRMEKISYPDEAHNTVTFILFDEQGDKTEYEFTAEKAQNKKVFSGDWVSKDNKVLLYEDGDYLKIYNTQTETMDSLLIEEFEFGIHFKISDDNKYIKYFSDNENSCVYYSLETKERLLELRSENSYRYFVMDSDFKYAIIKEYYATSNNLKKVFLLRLNLSTLSVEDFLDYSAQNRINVYPNPAQQDINIETAELINKIEIYSAAGELLNTISDISSTSAKIQLNNLSSGAYIIKVYFDAFTFSKKFIKE